MRLIRSAIPLGVGFLEKVYENALAHQLIKDGMRIEQQKSIKVYYDDVVVGDYFADLVVEGAVIVELKAAKNIEDIHLAQTLNYLKATGLKLGLILNFGKPRVEIKRVVNNLQPQINADERGWNKEKSKFHPS